jgi:hypothetical protein
MTQRARLDQLKRSRNNLNYRTFLEQFEEFEREAKHLRKPVATFGDLPYVGNKHGDECLVLDTGVKYFWDANIQNWLPLLGKGYDVPSGVIKRYRGKYIARGGETEVILSHRYDVGMNTLDVYINGLLQEADVDYREIDEITIEFTTPLETGMIVTYMMPYVVGNANEDADIRRRLLQIEHNHYQLMMVNYYQGKPVNSQALFFDGFLNTNYVDYIKTTKNIEYDNIRRTMRVATNTISKFQEVFDSDSQIDLTVSNLRLLNSEITLPVSQEFSVAFEDDFSTPNKLALEATTAYWDPELQQLAVDPYYSGGNHYQLGDFMGTTGGVERSGVYWEQAPCYSVAPGKNHMFAVHGVDVTLVPINRPFRNTDGGSMWVPDVSSENMSGASQHNSTHTWGAYYSNSAIRTLVYVPETDKLYFLQQDSEGGGRYNQKIRSFSTVTSSFTISTVQSRWYNNNRRCAVWGTQQDLGWPAGMPNTTGGSGKTDVIHSLGATQTHLLIRVEDTIYFVNPVTWSVEKVLDWSSAEIKPSRFLNNSMQFAADNRFLYFPWWGVYKEHNGYFVEVFDIEDGRFIDKYWITETYPTTTAMHYDFLRNRMILGLWGGNWYSLVEKGVAGDFSSNGSFAGFMLFDPPATGFSLAQSIPLTTNLSEVEYKLSATHVENGGVVEYFIRFNGAAWQRIDLDREYKWINPKKTGEATIELRVALKNNVGTSTSPIVTDWKLDIKQYLNEGIYVSKEQTLQISSVSSGKMVLNQDAPNETSIQWTIQLAPDAPEVPVSEDGVFSISDGLGTAYATIRARMATNNTLLSPVVRDFTLQMHYVEAGRLESTVYNQIYDIEYGTMWVTNTASNDYIVPYMSRDGGQTWVEGVREASVKLPDGSFESQYRFTFTGDEQIRNQAKVAFDIRGATEIVQYGVSINPL